MANLPIRLHLLVADELAAARSWYFDRNADVVSFEAYYVGLPFFALASTMCSYLWCKSGYIPKALASFGLIVSSWCVMCAFLFIVFPDFYKTVNYWWFHTPLVIFEMATGFWLLFFGLRPSVRAVPAKANG